jgi:hypothetical protein
MWVVKNEAFYAAQIGAKPTYPLGSYLNVILNIAHEERGC